jgi:hypothetical protein
MMLCDIDVLLGRTDGRNCDECNKLMRKIMASA